MGINDFKGKRWSGYILVACVSITFYLIMSNLGLVWGAVKGFFDNFTPFILGCVIAYLVNPLAKLYEKTIFSKVQKDKVKWTVSVILAMLTVILFLGFLLGTLVPQLIDSIRTFAGNFDGYVAALEAFAEKLQISKYVDMEKVWASSENLLETAKDYIVDNIGNILNASADAGKSIVSWVLGFILSIYLLLAKASVKNGMKRLLRALFTKKKYDGVLTFFTRCDAILARYIVYSLIDGLIIGIVNAVFMGVVGMQYVGLVSVVVAVTNLIPTFGPIIGAAIGGFVLLLVNPLHALAFLIFTLVLQICDGYIIKPKLFGDSLGISSLLILVAVVVGGNMFGVVGILLAIPFAAILDFIYKDYVLASLEARRAVKDENVDTEAIADVENNVDVSSIYEFDAAENAAESAVGSIQKATDDNKILHDGKSEVTSKKVPGNDTNAIKGNSTRAGKKKRR